MWLKVAEMVAYFGCLSFSSQRHLSGNFEPTHSLLLPIVVCRIQESVDTYTLSKGCCLPLRHRTKHENLFYSTFHRFHEILKPEALCADVMLRLSTSHRVASNPIITMSGINSLTDMPFELQT